MHQKSKRKNDAIMRTRTVTSLFFFFFFCCCTLLRKQNAFRLRLCELYSVVRVLTLNLGLCISSHLRILSVYVTNPVRGLPSNCHQRSPFHYSDSHTKQTVSHYLGLHFPCAISLITRSPVANYTHYITTTQILLKRPSNRCVRLEVALRRMISA